MSHSLSGRRPGRLREAGGGSGGDGGGDGGGGRGGGFYRLVVPLLVEAKEPEELEEDWKKKNSTIRYGRTVSSHASYERRAAISTTVGAAVASAASAAAAAAATATTCYRCLENGSLHIFRNCASI
ncbi:hypothetical protein V1477_005559 [Vespula maculifrons]|uniref:Uncharacterized protein n=1 Tax=Vespula maculifrons TaxID=7453 RepID=A0ABD2CQ04_VESMC